MARGKIYTNRKRTIAVGEEKTKKGSKKKDKKKSSSKGSAKEETSTPSGGAEYLDRRTGIVFSTKPEDSDIQCMEENITKFLKEKGELENVEDHLTVALHLGDYLKTSHQPSLLPPISSTGSDEMDTAGTTPAEIPITFWQEVKDPKTNHPYYWNPTTNEVSWTLPENAVLTSEASERSDEIHDPEREELEPVPQEDSNTLSDYYAYYSKSYYGADGSGTAEGSTPQTNGPNDQSGSKEGEMSSLTGSQNSIQVEGTTQEKKKKSKKQKTEETALLDKSSKIGASRPKKSTSPGTSPSLPNKQESQKLRLQVSNMADDLSRKLNYLHVTGENITELQILNIKLQTRLEDWKDGALSSKFLMNKLKDMDDAVQSFVQKEVSSEWLCIWDRGTCRYIFKNSVSGEVSYEFPTATGASPVSSSQQETMESMDENEDDDDDQESDEESDSNEDIDPNKVSIDVSEEPIMFPQAPPPSEIPIAAIQTHEEIKEEIVDEQGPQSDVLTNPQVQEIPSMYPPMAESSKYTGSYLPMSEANSEPVVPEQPVETVGEHRQEINGQGEQDMDLESSSGGDEATTPTEPIKVPQDDLLPYMSPPDSAEPQPSKAEEGGPLAEYIPEVDNSISLYGSDLPPPTSAAEVEAQDEMEDVDQAMTDQMILTELEAANQEAMLRARLLEKIKGSNADPEAIAEVLYNSYDLQMDNDDPTEAISLPTEVMPSTVSQEEVEENRFDPREAVTEPQPENNIDDVPISAEQKATEDEHKDHTPYHAKKRSRGDERTLSDDSHEDIAKVESSKKSRHTRDDQSDSDYSDDRHRSSKYRRKSLRDRGHRSSHRTGRSHRYSDDSDEGHSKSRRHRSRSRSKDRNGHSSKRKKDRKKKHRHRDSSSDEEHSKSSDKSRDTKSKTKSKEKEKEVKKLSQDSTAASTPPPLEKNFVPARYKPKGKSREEPDDDPSQLSQTQMEMMHNIVSATYPIVYPMDPQYAAAYGYTQALYDPNYASQLYATTTVEEPSQKPQQQPTATESVPVVQGPKKEESVTIVDVPEILPQDLLEEQLDDIETDNGEGGEEKAEIDPIGDSSQTESDTAAVETAAKESDTMEVAELKPKESHPETQRSELQDGSSDSQTESMPTSQVTEPASAIEMVATEPSKEEKPEDQLPQDSTNEQPSVTTEAPPTESTTAEPITNEAQSENVQKSESTSTTVVTSVRDSTPPLQDTGNNPSGAYSTISAPATSYATASTYYSDPSQAYAAYAQAATMAAYHPYYGQYGGAYDSNSYAAAMNYYAAYQAAYTGAYGAYYQQQAALQQQQQQQQQSSNQTKK